MAIVLLVYGVEPSDPGQSAWANVLQVLQELGHSYCWMPCGNLGAIAATMPTPRDSAVPSPSSPVAAAESVDPGHRATPVTLSDIEIVLVVLDASYTASCVAQVHTWAIAHQLPRIYLQPAEYPAELQQAAIATTPEAYLTLPVAALDLRHTIQLTLHHYHAHQRLVAGQQWLSTVMQSIGDGLIVCDRQGQLIYMNPVAETITGLKQQHCIGRRLDDLVQFEHVEDDRPFINPVLTAMQQCRSQRLPDACRLRVQGEIRGFVGDAATPIISATGEVIGGVLVFQDTTAKVQEQRTAEQRQYHLRLQQVVMTQLSKCQEIYDGNLAGALRRITSTAAHTLHAHRVGVWFFTDDRSQLTQIQEYDLETRSYKSGQSYQATEQAAYFAALVDSYKIAISDARADPRTANLDLGAVSPPDAWALLDTPIRFRGQAIGVLCCSYQGVPRRWTLEEQNFAGYLAHLVTLTLESQERSQIEHDLGESVATLQATLESTADGIFVVSRDGRALGYNQKFIDMWDLAPEMLAPDFNGIDRFRILAQRTVNPAQFMQRVLELFDLNPEAVACDRLELTNGLILDRYSQPLVRDGEIIGRSWSYRDITQAVLAEQALRRSEEQLRQIFDHIDDVFYLKDSATGEVIYINPAYDQMFQRSVQDMLTNPNAWLEMVHPDDRDRVQQVAQAEVDYHLFQNLEYRIIRPDRSIRWIRDHAFPIRDASGKVYRFAGVNQDITEQKQAEAMLRDQVAQEQWLSEVAEQLRYSLSLPEILTIAAQAIQARLACDRVIVYQFDSAISGIVVAEAVQTPWRSLLGDQITDPCFREENCLVKYRHGAISAITNLAEAETDPCHTALLQSLQVQANLLIPIRQGDHLWGLLGLHQCGGPRVWQDHEVQLLRRLVEQMAIAIQQSHLYTQTQRQALREQALNRVVQVMRNSLELPQIFQATMTEVQALLNAHQARIMRHDPQPPLAPGESCESSFVCWSALQELATTLPTAGDNCSLQQGCPLAAIHPHDLNQLVLQRLQQFCVVRSDIEDGTALTHALRQALPDDFLLLLPIRALTVQTELTQPAGGEPELWGVLILLRDRQDADWESWEVDVGLAIAEQLAVAIQQSQLYHQVQALNVHLEEDVIDRTQQLQRAFEFERILKRITERVRDSLDEIQILQAAVRELAIVLDAESCDAGIYDLEQQISTIVCDYVKWDFPSLQGQVVEMAMYADYYRQLLQAPYLHFCWVDPLPIAGRELRAHFSTLVCPMRDDQGVLGDLWIYRPGAVYFDEAEIRLVEQVANQCAIALRQARLYQATQKQVEELERLNQLKDDFLSTVSHELRTPMATIQMATQMLQVLISQPDVATQLSDYKLERLERYLEILRTECSRETRLINDLLDLSRLDAETEPLQYTTIAPHLWINHVVESYAAQFDQRQQQLTIAVPKELPLLTTDVNYVDRILRELLQNAHKYTPADHQIWVTASSAKVGWLQIHVCNTGVEISPTEQLRVFDKFYRIPNNDPWQHAGTGLGLALAQKIALYLGGDITLLSSDRGAKGAAPLPPLTLSQPPEAWVCFTLHLPLHPSSR